MKTKQRSINEKCLSRIKLSQDDKSDRVHAANDSNHSSRTANELLEGLLEGTIQK